MWFHRFQRSCFRLECLQHYSGSGEDDSISSFLAGESPQPHPGKREWMALVRAAVSDGRTMQRVHVIREPLTPYATFEIAWSYAYNVAAGEDVRLVSLAEDEAWPCGIPRPGGDFWLFDDRELFQMHYEPDGRWLGITHIDERARVETACRFRASAVGLAQPWMSYINKRPELARRVPNVQWQD